MFNEIGNISNVSSFLEKCKAKETRLWGFGHRVFKAYDPRARILKNMLTQFLETIDQEHNKLVEIAFEVER